MSRKVDDVSETSAVLRSIALNYGVPVVAASQLSRLIEHRGVNAPPTLSDLRESGSLEQDATQVWFQRWHWAEPTPTQINMFPQNIDPRGVPYMVPKALPVRTFVEKNRNGPTGVTPPYLWVMATNDFLPLSRLEDM
jgi:replicative DNA helicase